MNFSIEYSKFTIPSGNFFKINIEITLNWKANS
jgi:hypothetical protein